MGLFQGYVYSSVLGMESGVNVILPSDWNPSVRGQEMKVLYLLHGMSDSFTKWVRMTNVERYANERGIAVVMPDAQRSFYADMCYGLNYFTYIAEELPILCQNMFRISAKPENTYIAGLSMGGYGAFKCAFTYPENYAGSASFSGAVEAACINDLVLCQPQQYKETQGIFGLQRQVPQESDLFLLAEKAAIAPKKPKIFQSCGFSDFLYQSNLHFKAHFEKMDYDYRYLEWEGDHTWEFWDVSLKLALDWFLGGEEPTAPAV